MKSRLFVLVFGLSVATSACGPSQADFDARGAQITALTTQNRTITAERDRLNTQATSLRTSSEAMANRLRALGEDVSRLQTTNEQTQSELEAARRSEAELRTAQQQSEARLATFRQMIQRFQAMINSGQLRVRASHGRMVIELPAGILFESGDARLRGPGEVVIRQVATVLSQIPDRDFLVAGHTDNVQLGRGGRYRDNWDLSAERAVSVARFLQQNGVPPAHLGAAGYAEFAPVAPNDTDANKALNRRVEIILMPNINELPDLTALDPPPASAPAR